MIDQNRLRRFSITLFILTLVMLVIHMESLIRFNRHEFHIHGNESNGMVQMEIDARADSTSSWLKREFEMDDGQRVDLTGQTIDGTLRNQSSDTLQDWELRINIVGDCYINQAWNGEVEIHQFTGTDREKVQRMNLQDYQLEDVTFEYRYDGDLLIPLQAGDYVIYYPSTRFSEMPIKGGDDVKIGVIFYYLDALDLSDYDVVIHFHRLFTQGFTFYAFVVLAVLWVLSMVVNGAGTLAYRRAMKDMELRKAGIFSMSDIYDLIYIIHLPTGEMTPVSVDEKLERERPKNKTAKELLTNLISVEGKPLEDVVFTVQNINDEKQEQEAVIHRIEEAESINEAKVAFMDSIADDLQRPLEKLVMLNGQILSESRDESIRRYARSAYGASSRVLLLTEGIMDGFDIESGKARPAAKPYSLRGLLTDTLHIVVPLAEENGFSVALDISQALPDQLSGDSRLLREVLVNMVSGSLPATDRGRVQLALYGKAVDDRIHLLFSVRVYLDSHRVSEASGLNHRVVAALLTGMGSELKSVRSPAGHSEVYFEIEQRVLDPAPIGALTIDDAGA